MGKIISIHSFRGGTGKSNTTANLAAQAALRGHRVAIVDTDIQSPGIHVLFGLDDTMMGHTLNDFLHGQCSIQDIAHPITSSAGGPGVQALVKKTIWLVPSSIKTQEISRVLKEGYDVGLLNKGLNGLLKELKLDYLFIDTHPGLNEETILSIAISDALIIILRPDQQDFQGTAVTVDIARSLDVPNLFLVVNKALTRYDFKQMRDKVQETYHATVAGILPLTEDMADLGSSDVFSLRFPDHPWSKALLEVADTVLSVK
jgi:MinD-like ATPase involved in chromosome partitioning or flagellar assembly